ncbi:MAG: hypothetical protein AVDCRST_MAG48-1267 [uncultured Friedmanniella sp.]|uniref:Uncharacterized protein n=1 Tax=uncultured Friedmanniella sp. TaxID=335381 RepID=A0A6J4KB62_9ACTN|nr:MAG: hypothetical protein AVDCRST_MAG48-1267 [uncultured Friedmanniella sp.]
MTGGGLVVVLGSALGAREAGPLSRLLAVEPHLGLGLVVAAAVGQVVLHRVLVALDDEALRRLGAGVGPLAVGRGRRLEDRDLGDLLLGDRAGLDGVVRRRDRLVRPGRRRRCRRGGRGRGGGRARRPRRWPGRPSGPSPRTPRPPPTGWPR